MATNSKSPVNDLELNAIEERLEFERLFPEKASAHAEIREYHSKVIEKLSNIRNAILMHHHNIITLRLQYQDLKNQANKLDIAD